MKDVKSTCVKKLIDSRIYKEESIIIIQFFSIRYLTTLNGYEREKQNLNNNYLNF